MAAAADDDDYSIIIMISGNNRVCCGLAWGQVGPDVGGGRAERAVYIGLDFEGGAVSDQALREAREGQVVLHRSAQLQIEKDRGDLLIVGRPWSVGGPEGVVVEIRGMLMSL